MKRFYLNFARVATIAFSFLFVLGLSAPPVMAGGLDIETADVELESVRRALAGAEGEAFLRLRIDDDDSVLFVTAEAEGLDEGQRYSLFVDDLFIDSDLSDEDGNVFFRGVRRVDFDTLEDVEVVVREGRRGVIVLEGFVEDIAFEERERQFIGDDEEERVIREREEEERALGEEEDEEQRIEDEEEEQRLKDREDEERAKAREEEARAEEREEKDRED